ncbi:MAG: hypothetical protein AAF988_03990 [Pseudomonadota bacterium]
MLTIEFETTDRSQLIEKIKEFVEAIPAAAYLDKRKPLIGIINSKQYSCGKSIIWDVFVAMLLAEKVLDEDSHTWLRGDEDLLGPEENLNPEHLTERQAEMWVEGSDSADEKLRLHFYNALDLFPMLEEQMHNDMNSSHHPNVAHEYLPNVILVTNRNYGPTDFLIEMEQPPAIERSLIETSWQLKTRITIYNDRLANCAAVRSLAL